MEKGFIFSALLDMPETTFWHFKFIRELFFLLFVCFVKKKKKFIEKTSQKALLSIATEIIKMIASCQSPAVIRLENMSEIKYQLQAEHTKSRIKANFSCMYWLKILIPKPGQC